MDLDFLRFGRQGICKVGDPTLAPIWVAIKRTVRIGSIQTLDACYEVPMSITMDGIGPKWCRRLAHSSVVEKRLVNLCSTSRVCSSWACK